MEIEKKNLEFEDEEINQLIKRLNNCFDNQQGNFATVCYTVYKIDCWFIDNSDCLLKSKYTADYYKEKQLFKMLGFSNKQVNRYIHCYKKFMTLDDVGSKIKEPFVSFTSSKLFEMLPIGTDKLIELISSGQISADMTVKQIREFLKSVVEKEEPSNCEDDEENTIDLTGDYFLVLKNDIAREDFLKNYKTWGLWFEESRLKLKYFRCKIGEKILVAVCSGFSFGSGADTVSFHYLYKNGALIHYCLDYKKLINDMRKVKDKRIYLFN